MTEYREICIKHLSCAVPGNLMAFFDHSTPRGGQIKVHLADKTEQTIFERLTGVAVAENTILVNYF